MSEKERFLEIFVANFLSTWAANNYDAACASGEHKRLSNPPIEDALFLAEEHWKALLNVRL